MSFKRFLVFILIIALLSIFSYFYPQIQELTGQAAQSQKTAEYPLETAVLLRVIDGDTIEIDNGPHVRLLGINTPEKNMPFSNESKKFLSQFVNKTITLERDSEDTDKYKRKLRYLFFEDRFVNQEILEQGYANSYYTLNLKYEQQLLNAEQQAKTSEIGIWTKSQEECSLKNCIYLKELDYQDEFFTIGNNCSYSCNLTKWFVKDAGRNVFYLSQINSQEEQTIHSKNSTEVWNNNGDRFFIFDKKGLLVLFYQYP